MAQGRQVPKAKAVARWFVWQTMSEEPTGHPNYQDAVLEAQCRGCTEDRPKRLHKGFYIVTGCSGNRYSIGTRNGRINQGFPDPIQKTITRDELARMSVTNSPRIPSPVNDHGIRKTWVGIGWVSEGPATGKEVRVIDPSGK